MAELVDAADSKSVFERSGSSILPRGTKQQHLQVVTSLEAQKNRPRLSRFFCGRDLADAVKGKERRRASHRKSDGA
jgi:hypothetical protein